MYSNEKISIDCIWIGVGINLKSEDPCYFEIVKLNKTLQKQYGSSYIFSSSNPPHINLYDIDIPKDNLDKVSTSLEQIARKWKPFSVKLSSIDYFKHGAIYIRCEFSDTLVQLEKKIVETLVDCRGGCRTEDYWQPWREYSQEHITNRDKYGNPHVLNTFTPHITLGYVKTNLSHAVKMIKQTFIPTELNVKQVDMAIQNADGEFTERRQYNFV